MMCANASMLVKIGLLLFWIYSRLDWCLSYILPTNAYIDRFAFVANPVSGRFLYRIWFSRCLGLKIYFSWDLWLFWINSNLASQSMVSWVVVVTTGDFFLGCISPCGLFHFRWRFIYLVRDGFSWVRVFRKCDFLFCIRISRDFCFTLLSGSPWPAWVYSNVIIVRILFFGHDNVMYSWLWMTGSTPLFKWRSQFKPSPMARIRHRLLKVSREDLRHNIACIFAAREDIWSVLTSQMKRSSVTDSLFSLDWLFVAQDEESVWLQRPMARQNHRVGEALSS